MPPGPEYYEEEELESAEEEDGERSARARDSDEGWWCGGLGRGRLWCPGRGRAGAWGGEAEAPGVRGGLSGMAG